MTITITQEAITAAANAMRHKWLQDHPGIVNCGLDPMDWAQTALEAAAPHLRHAEGPTSHAATHPPRRWTW